MPEARWLSLTRLGPRHIPVVGPTEALHGRPGGPGMAVPRGAVPGRLGHQRKSGWQLAHQVWQDAGVDWEGVVAAPRQPDPYDPDTYEPGPYKQNLPQPTAYGPDPYAPGPYESDPDEPDPDEPEVPAPRLSAPDPGVPGAYPAGQYESDPDAPGPYAADPYPGLSALADLAAGQAATSRTLTGTDQDPFSPADEAPDGPHSTRPDLPVLRESADSRLGIGPWPVQQPATVPQPAIVDQVADGPVEPGEPRKAPRSFGPPPAFAPPAFTAPRSFGAPPAFAPPQLGAPPNSRRGAPLSAPPRSAPPLSAPPRSAPPNARRGTPLGAPLSAPVAPAAPPLGQSDELFRAWQGSVRQATARRSSWPAPRPDSRPASAAARHRRAWQAARIGVPAAVIVTVGAGALMMLTGRANDMLAQRSNAVPLASAAPGVSAGLSIAAQGVAGTTLAGYPGGHGGVAVAALWPAGGTIMAVGYADGHPAVWRHAAGGVWSLVSATVFGGLTGHLTSLAQGPAGWIAVGSAAADGTAEPVAFVSADGVTWSPLLALTGLASANAQFLGVASGPDGYVVVGKRGTGAGAYASFWWSADLRDWASGGNGSTGSVAAAAVSAGNGFVAVGSTAHSHAIWTSEDGRQWTEHDLTKPAGASSATLLSVAAGRADRFVAAGFATKSAGDIPVVVTSTGAGAPLTQVVLGAQGAPAIVTGVTATSGGFVAVGLAGQASAQHAVEWTSPDGLTWSAAAPVASAGTSGITAFTSSGGTAIGTAQRGADPAVLTIPSR